MSLPSIADVKEAAEFGEYLAADVWESNGNDEVAIMARALATLQTFTLAVLSSPGMTAEQLDAINEGWHIISPADYIEELLAEVLRLRAVAH